MIAIILINSKTYPNHLKHLEGQGYRVSWGSFPEVACFYYAYKEFYGSRKPLYVGETKNLKGRILNIGSVSTLNEATHIFIFPEEDKKSRVLNKIALSKFFFGE